MISPDAVRRVRSSSKKIAPIAVTSPETFAGDFYHRLFAIAPEVRDLFPADMSEQKMKLMSILGFAVNSLSDLDVLIPELRALGVRHVGYGVEEAHYAAVTMAMLQTLEHALGDAWTPEICQAWTELYAEVSNVMIGAASEYLEAKAARVA
ncbi:MAG TPA: globin family protein [Thermohalobaculum sp.]|nr:globin family protein [Thermohalobaculum sp.]